MEQKRPILRGLNTCITRIPIYPYIYPFYTAIYLSRYKMLKHGAEKANPERFKYLYSGAKRISKDGYNSLKYR